MKKNYYVFLIMIIVIFVFSACMFEEWLFPGFNTPTKRASNVEVTYSPLSYGYVGQKFEIQVRTNDNLKAGYIKLITTDGQVMEKTNTSFATFYVTTTTEQFGFVVEIPGKTGKNPAFKSPVMTADDRTPPEVTVSYQRVNDYSNDFTITLWATDAQSPIRERWVLIDDEILLMNNVRGDTSSIRKNLSIEEHSLIGFARNQKGLKGNSIPVTFQVEPPSGDNTPPEFKNVALYMPDGRDFAYKGEEIRVIGSVEDDISYIKRIDLQSPGNSPWIIDESRLKPNVDFDYLFEAQTSGNVIITAKNGNNLVSQKTIPENSTLRVVDHQAPKVKRVFEITGEEPLEGNELIYRVEFEKSEGTSIRKLEIKLDGALYLTDMAPSEPFDFNYIVEKGEREFVINIWDDRGAKGTHRFKVTGLLDDNEGPMIYMNLSPSIPYKNENSRIYVACRDESGIDMSSVKLRIKGADKQIIPVKENSYYYDWTPTATGIHRIELFVKDKLGNESQYVKEEEVYHAEDLKGPGIKTFSIDQEELYYGDAVSFTAVILPAMENPQGIEAWVEISDPMNKQQARGAQLPMTLVDEENNAWKTQSHVLTGSGMFEATLYARSGDYTNRRTIMFEIKDPTLAIKNFECIPANPAVGEQIQLRIDVSILPKSEDVFIEKSGVKFDFDTSVFYSQSGVTEIENDPLKRFVIDLMTIQAQAQEYTFNVEVEDSRGQKDSETIRIEFREPKTEVSIVASPTGAHYANDEIVFGFPYSVTPGVNINPDFLLMDIKNPDGTSFIGGEKQLNNIPFMSEPIRFEQVGIYTVDATLVFDDGSIKNAKTFNLNIQRPGISFEINTDPTGDHYVNDEILLRFPYSVSNNANLRADYVSYDIRDSLGQSMISGPVQLNDEPFVSESYSFVESGTYQLAATLTFENGDSVVASPRELVIQDVDFTFSIDANPSSSPYYINQPISFSFPFAITQEIDIEPKYVNLSIKNASDVVTNSQQLNTQPFETSAFRFMNSGEYTMTATMAFDNIENTRTRTKTINIEDTRITWDVESNGLAIGNEITFIAWINNNNEYDTLPETFNVKIMNNRDEEIGNISMKKDSSSGSDELTTMYTAQNAFTFREEGPYTLRANILTSLGALVTLDPQEVWVSKNLVDGSLIPEPLESYIGQEQRLVLTMDQIATTYNLQNIRMWATPTVDNPNGNMREIANIQGTLPEFTGIFINDATGNYHGVAEVTFGNPSDNWKVRFKTTTPFEVENTPEAEGSLIISPATPVWGRDEQIEVTFNIRNFVSPIDVEIIYDGSIQSFEYEQGPVSETVFYDVKGKGSYSVELIAYLRGNPEKPLFDNIEKTFEVINLEPDVSFSLDGADEYIKSIKNIVKLEIDNKGLVIDPDDITVSFMTDDDISLNYERLRVEYNSNTRETHFYEVEPVTVVSTVTAFAEIRLDDEESEYASKSFTAKESTMSVSSLSLVGERSKYMGFAPGFTGTVESNIPKNMIGIRARLVNLETDNELDELITTVSDNGVFSGSFTSTISQPDQEYSIKIYFDPTDPENLVPIDTTTMQEETTFTSKKPGGVLPDTYTVRSYKVYEIPYVKINLGDSEPSGLTGFDVSISVEYPSGGNETYTQQGCESGDSVETPLDWAEAFTEEDKFKTATTTITVEYEGIEIASDTLVGESVKVKEGAIEITWLGFKDLGNEVYVGQSLKPRASLNVNLGKQITFTIGENESVSTESPVVEGGNYVYESGDSFYFGTETTYDAVASIEGMDNEATATVKVQRGISNIESFVIKGDTHYTGEKLQFTGMYKSTFDADSIGDVLSISNTSSLTSEILNPNGNRFTIDYEGQFDSGGDQTVTVTLNPQDGYLDTKTVDFYVYTTPEVESNVPSEVASGSTVKVTMDIDNYTSELDEKDLLVTIISFNGNYDSQTLTPLATEVSGSTLYISREAVAETGLITVQFTVRLSGYENDQGGVIYSDTKTITVTD